MSIPPIFIIAGASCIIALLSDNGKGFHRRMVEAKRKKNSGLGLVGMMERVTLLGGTVHLKSASNKGTEIVIRIPMNNKSNESHALYANEK